MQIAWRGHCFSCACPLDVEFEPADELEDTWLDQFEAMYPPTRLRHDIDFDGNVSIWKRFGERSWNRVCQSCFDDTRLVTNARAMRDREIGKTRLRRPRSVSMSQGELEQYAYMMRLYFNMMRKSIH